jgi:hypothetical protein
LRYHARALFGSELWAPYRASLHAWLSRFEQRGRRVVLVGPSAAHCISDAFLSQFSEITALEPDPLAGFLLARRFRRLGLPEPHIERKDQLVRPLLENTPGLAERLSAQPDTCVVFCNLLGQARFLMTDDEFLRFKAAFRTRIVPVLAERAWLSFHDRFSGALAPVFDAPFTAPARLSDAEELRQLYRAEGVGSRELLDHESDGFFPEQLPHAYLSWRIDRQRSHLIEGVASAGAAR